MIDNDTSNSHLKDNISQYAHFKKNNTPVPEDLIVDIFNELRVSKLIVPGIVEDDDVIFQNIMFDDKFDLIPLFTDADEFKKYTTEYTGITNDFSYYVDLVMKEDLDGMVINLKGDMFFIDKFLLQKIPHLEKCDDSDVEGYDGQQLRDIYRNLPNKKLIKFINNPKNFNKYDKLIKLLHDAVLLIVVSSPVDLSDVTEDGVIRREDTKGYELAYVDEGKETYGLIYTGAEAVIKSANIQQQHYYCQIANISEMFPYYLSMDMSGVIIDPVSADYYIPRNIMLELLEHEDIDDAKLKDAQNYLFPVEE